VKVSVRQIQASAAGAVIAALIASSFGVKGTIIGVAIGSIAATTGSALVFQSLERGHEAVKQAVGRAPEASTLLRRIGGTRVSQAAPSASSASTQATGRAVPERDDGADTGCIESTAAPVGETERLDISARTDAPATERLRAGTAPPRPASSLSGVRRFSWGAIAGTAAIVFVLALLFITAVELISGEPLAAVFGGADSGTTLQNLVNPAPAATRSTTTTTVPSESTTTTTATTTTTTESTGREASTTTSQPSASTTTTTAGAGATTTTTTVAPSP
jgi:hypothetical protein